MSKIGKININIPEKTKVIMAGNALNIEGPLGKKTLSIDTEVFDLDIKEGKEISIKPKKINDETKRLWGLNRSLVNNAILGVNLGYKKTLELTGVGFRAALKGNHLNFKRTQQELSSSFEKPNVGFPNADSPLGKPNLWISKCNPAIWLFKQHCLVEFQKHAEGQQPITILHG